jgi:hypothetical protein
MVSRYPTGFANGLSVRGVPILNAYAGQVLWVSSTTGSNQNKGTRERPFASIDYAVGKCNADKGDIIMVMPTHAETVSEAGGLDLDVSGIRIIGLGEGRQRPKVNIGTVTTASVQVDSYDITVENIIFQGQVDALVNPIHVRADSFTMVSCLTADITGQATDFIVTSASTVDRLEIYDHMHLGSSSAGADTWLTIVGGSQHIIVPRFIDGNFAVAAVRNVTTAMTQFQMYGNAINGGSYMRTRNAADVIFTAVAASTGRVGPFINARLQDNAANITEAFVGAAMEFFQPVNIVNADGESSMQTNITASTDA